jgi:hypothetical protein
MVVPRREHDAAVAHEHERIAELEAENETLREYIELQAAERQAVIERYERILDRRDAVASTSSTPSGSSTSSTAVASDSPSRRDDPLGGVRRVLSDLRTRLTDRLRLD